jgi:predicted TIM-barrel fold metal-dependent hydrolase
VSYGRAAAKRCGKLRRMRAIVFSLCLATGVFAAEREPIIDVHLHTHAAARFGQPGVPDPVTGKPSKAVTDDALMNAAFGEMKRLNIVTAIGFSAPDMVQRWVAASDGHVIPGAQIFDVGLPLPTPAELRADIVAGRVKMIGEVGPEYVGLAPNDPALEPYFALAEELDVPVGLHTGLGPPNAPYECCPKFRVTLGRPTLLEEVLIKHPKLRIYLMHAGWPYLDDTIALMSVYPNVYLDVSVIDWVLPPEEFHGYLKSLLRAGLGKRIMYGSDQMIWPEAIARSVAMVESTPGLTHAQKRDIFYNNAVRFFRLTKEQVKRW